MLTRRESMLAALTGLCATVLPLFGPLFGPLVAMGSTAEVVFTEGDIEWLISLPEDELGRWFTGFSPDGQLLVYEALDRFAAKVEAERDDIRKYLAKRRVA